MPDTIDTYIPYVPNPGAPGTPPLEPGLSPVGSSLATDYIWKGDANGYAVAVLDAVTGPATLTGDVTGSGTGTFVTTIGAAKVTNAMLAGSIAYSKLALTGAILNADLSTFVSTDKGGTGVDNSSGGTANQFWARPNGATGAAAYRAIVAADVPTLNQSSTGSAAFLTTARTLALTGDVTWTSPSFDGSANVTASATIANGSVTYAKRADLGALAVAGRSANTSGVGADIQATAASGAVLRESGSTIGWGTIATAGIADNAVTLAKLATMATTSLLGRSTAATGNVEVLSASTARTLLGLATTDSPTLTGLTLSGLTAGSVLFAGTAGIVQQDNANLFWDDTNNRLGIGTASPSNTFEVNTTLNLVGLNSANIARYLDLVTIYTPNYFNVVNTGAPSGTNSALVAFSNSSQTSGTSYAGYFQANIPSTNANNQGQLAGLSVNAYHLGTGTVSTLTGNIVGCIANSSGSVTTVRTIAASGSIGSSYSGGTITNLQGFVSSVLNNSAATTITNVYGFILNNLTNAGTITNTYGYYVGDITTGTQTNTPFSFYASDTGAFNYFAGRTGIGVTAPTAVLHLKAGTTAASTAPIKFNSGSLLTTAEAGAVEFLTDAWYGTITTGAARKTFAFLESPVFTSASAATVGQIVRGAASQTADLAQLQNSSATVLAKNDFSGAYFQTSSARTSGVASFFSVTTPADTGLTASTESIGVNFTGGTRQWDTGVLTTQRGFVVAANTLAFVGASTITTAATFVITAAPIAGTNATITNAYALWVQAGRAQFDGIVAMGSTLRLKGYTVAGLPAGVQGDTAFVSDALAPTFLTTVVGGGSVVTTVFYNGTNWIAQ